jgi:hypothetical protein
MTTHCDDCLHLDRLCDACAEAAELRAHAAWDRYCQSGLKPIYVPDRPDLVYSEVWRGWQDWMAWNEAGARSPWAAKRAA